MTHNNISIYASTINGKDKKELLAIYREYASLVSCFSYIQSIHTPKALASMMCEILNVNKDNPFPFVLTPIKDTEKENYKNFMRAIPLDKHNYAYVNAQAPKPEETEEFLYTTPKNYDVYTDVKSLPNIIERVIVAYPKDCYPDEILFNINGKHILKYNQYSPKTLKELFSDNDDDTFIKMFSIVLSIASQLPENIKDMDYNLYEKINIEANITELMSIYESIILLSLANLTEKQDRILKQILLPKERQNYLSKAESQGLIPSVYLFQDLLNVRHLIHHQFDTLEGFGRFMNNTNTQNSSIRKKNLESYNRLFNKSFAERMNTYKEIQLSLQPLVKGLCPNILIRDKQESNSKFLQRVREFTRLNPNQELYIELNHINKDKKESLMKTLNKLAPNAKFIDKGIKEFDDLSPKMKSFAKRHRFLKKYQMIETNVHTHYMYNGQNLFPNQSWDMLVKQKIITPKELQEWNEFKSFRNELTHEYLDEDKSQKLDEIFERFITSAFSLDEKIALNTPRILSQTNDYKITFLHPDGKTVEVDLKTKKILNVSTPNGKVEEVKPHTFTRQGEYTETLPNNIKLTTKKTNILSLEFNNGIRIDTLKNKIYLPNNTKLFLNENHKHYLITPQAKLIMDEDFEVISHIQKQKNIPYSKNEKIIFPNSYLITLDNNTRLSTLKFNTKDNVPFNLNIKKTNDNIEITLKDNTTIIISKKQTKIYHNKIELTYENKEKFANSYTLIPPNQNYKIR